ncbi:MAG: uroporphyrinogen decarboxylase family protein [Armatimonadota bacterium]
MTKRERYLKALRNEQVDHLVWAPNFDYWYGINKAQGTLPDQYKDSSRDDIVRAIDATIWARAGGIRIVYDSSVKVKNYKEGSETIDILETPIGTVRQVHVPTESKHSTAFLKEHFVKDLDSMKVMQYVVESAHCEFDPEPAKQTLRNVGDDGIALAQVFCVPFIQFTKTDAGYENGLYMWMDYKEEVDKLCNAYQRLFLEGISLMADSCLDVISVNDNMDGVMISPEIFKEYAIPFYQEARKIVNAKGKLFQGHWCGRTQSLLPLVPECGLNIVEAIVSQPMADISLNEALDLLKGEVVMQGGIPAVIVCNEGGSYDDFVRYLREVIEPLKNRKGFILGMSDNVPPNADFKRIEKVAEILNIK